jgi:LEA14-like dessication related protein
MSDRRDRNSPELGPADAPAPCRARAAIVVVAALCAATGCAPLAPRFQPPTVHVESIRVATQSGANTRLYAVLVVNNPNPVAIGIRSVDAHVAVDGQVIATVTLDDPITLPAGSPGRVEIEVRPDLPAIARIVERGSRQRVVRYELVGRAVTGDGLALDFNREGEVPLSAFLLLDLRR